MLRYVARRLVWMVVALLAVSAITFVIFFVLPAGDPAQRSAGSGKPSPERIEAVRRRLALDKPAVALPWHESQVRRYYERLLLHGDLGRSYEQNAPVAELIGRNLPATIQLAVGAMVVTLLVSLPVGVISAVRRRSWLDRALMGGALVALSAPVYWLGLVSLSLFDETLGAIPLLPAFDGYVPFGEDPVQWFGSMLLPWLVLAAGFAAVYARMLRANLIEVMGEDYIRTARAKGLDERRVVMGHGVRAAGTPIITILGIDLGVLLGGAVLTESVFNVPGIGRMTVEAIRAQDLPTIQGTVLFGAACIVVLTLLVDIAYALLDPRVRY